MVWIRSNHFLAPNLGQVAGLWEDADEEKYFGRASITRWTVPMDDTNCWIFGFRHFNSDVDPKSLGQADECGHNCVDFFGQTGERSYEEKQRTPGDFEAQIGQRQIAVHDLENRGRSDEGVTRMRRILRRGISDLTQIRQPADKIRDSGLINTYTHDTVLRIPQRQGVPDEEMMENLGRRVLRVILDGDSYKEEERYAKIKQDLIELFSQFSNK